MKFHAVGFVAVFCVMACLRVQGAPTTQPASLDAKPVLQAYAHRVEDEIGELMQRRSDSTGNPALLLDVQIDLRVIADALLTRAISNSAGPDLAACAYLRARELCAVAGEAPQRLANATLTSDQLGSIKQLHERTFAIPASGSEEQMDQMSREFGSLLLKVLGPLPAGMTDLPAMRPSVAGASESIAPRTRSLDELIAAAHRVAVGADLKRALIALADETSAAASDSARQAGSGPPDRPLLYSIEITESLQRGGLVDSQEREKTEAQLTRAILLFLDVRTRAAGKSRIEDLLNYRRMLQRVQAMHLSSELRDRLIPAFTWIRQHPDDDGPEAMDDVEAYVRLCYSYDSRDRAVLPGPQKRAVDVLEKRFARQRQTFLTDAAALGESDNPADDLDYDLSELRRTSDAIALIEQIPAEMKSLAPYRSRLAGGLERRAVAAGAVLGSDAEGPGVESARRFLSDLRSMSRLANQLAHATLPADIEQLYANGHLSDFNRLRGDLLSALATEASTRELTAPQRAQLDAALELGDALNEAVIIEGLKQQQALDRWVDWDVSPDAIGILLGSYRDATADAVRAFGQRDGRPFKAWEAEHARTAVLRELLDSVAVKADACQRLPSGWAGKVAKLLTPMGEQPFGLERYASLVLSDVGSSATPSSVILSEISERGSAVSPLPPG
ncbi:MAG TPA: hypothetical protein VN541_12885 [Tepidisphaeraceae bacterium]|nr:hypothetical protein [Tepidisphaeraceae bacterium]